MLLSLLREATSYAIWGIIAASDAAWHVPSMFDEYYQRSRASARELAMRGDLPMKVYYRGVASSVEHLQTSADWYECELQIISRD